MKKLLLTILLIGLTGCSLQPPFGSGLTAIQKEIKDKPYLKLKAPKDKILAHKEITVEKKSDLLGASATSTAPVENYVKETVVSYDYISDVKETAEYVFTTDEFSNQEIVKRDGNKITANFHWGDQAYKDATGVYKIVKGATTTPEAFVEQTKLSLLDKVKRFFGKPALATTTNYDADITNSKGNRINSNASWSATFGGTTGTVDAIDANVQTQLAKCFDLGGPSYSIKRGALVFTTDLPAGATVTGVKIYIYTNSTSWDYAGYSAYFFDNAAFSVPITAGQYDRTGWSSEVLGSITLAAIAASQGNKEITLSNSGFTFIVDGTTKIGVRIGSSPNGGDMGTGTAPVAGSSDGAIVYIYTGTSGDDPYLAITYTEAATAAPSVGEFNLNDE